MRICLVYDHLYPQTIGGTERWMRDLALRLAQLDHEVTYLTMRHWSPPNQATVSGVNVIGLATPGRIYREERRTFGPPVRFGLAVGWHLATRGRGYDIVHTAAFPYFPLLAAAAARRRGGYELFVDWHEVWTRRYWRRYAGAIAGRVGWLVQRACIRLPQRAFCVARMGAVRLVEQGYRGSPTVLPGLYAGPTQPTSADHVDPELIVYAGRHVAEKRVDALVRAFAHAKATRRRLRLEIFGDGPKRPEVEQLVADLGLADSVTVAGRRAEAEVDAALGRAACVATASEREGYGLVVVEAAARGTPSVVVAGSENAATELVQEGVNGAVARDASPEELAAALVRVVEAGPRLRASTTRWFAENVGTLTLEQSLEVVTKAYEEARATRPTSRGTVAPRV